jgi:hypothetical protein
MRLCGFGRRGAEGVIRFRGVAGVCLLRARCSLGLCAAAGLGSGSGVAAIGVGRRSDGFFSACGADSI